MVDDTAMEEEDEEETKPILHIYFGIEATQIHGSHEPNLLICETDEEEEPIEFHGTGCVAEFLEFVENVPRKMNVRSPS